MLIKSYPHTINSAFNNFHEVDSELDSFTLEHWFDLSSDIIWFKLINKEENKTYLNIKLPYSLISENIKNADQSLWGIIDFKIVELLGKEDVYEVTALDINNIFINSQSQKPLISKIDYDICPFKLFVPKKGCSLSECSFLIRSQGTNTFPGLQSYDKQIIVTVTGPSGAQSSVSSVDSWKSVISNITISIVSQDANNIVVGVSVEDTSLDEVYLEPVYGAVNGTRVGLTNGTGSFVVSKQGMSTGSKIRVKLGYKYFTGVTEFTATV
jgi:hypothetical protein